MANRYDEQLLLGYLEGDLAPPERARFEKMMAEDPQLSTLVSQMIDDRRGLRRLPRENPPADLMDQVASRLERSMLLDAPPPELNPVTQPRGFRNTRVLAYAGLAAMILISTAVVMYTLVDPKLYDQLAVTGHDNQTLANANKASRAEPAAPLSPLQPSVGLKTDSLALKQEFDLADEGRRRSTPQPDAELQPPNLALGQSKTNRERSFDDSAAQSKAGQSLAIAQEKNTRAFELRLPSSGRTRQNRALGKTESKEIETFARLTHPQTPAASLDPPQEAPGELAQKIMRHLAQLEEELPTDSPAEKEKVRHVEAIPQTSVSRRDTDNAPAGAFRQTLRGAAPILPQPMRIEASVPDLTEAQQTLLGWAVLNHIQIIRLASSDTKPSAGQDTADESIGWTTVASGPSNQIVLAMPAGDIPRLLEHLNGKPGQSARLVAQPQFWDQTKRQDLSDQPENATPRVDPLATTDTPRGLTLDHRSQPDTAEPDDAKNYPQLPVIHELDWGQLLLPRLPFRPVIPVYSPETPVRVTVHLYLTDPASDD